MLTFSQFDNITVIPEVSALNAVGVYDGVQFNGFDASEPGVGGVALDGIVPHSKPIHIVSGIENQLLAPANLTVAYAKSPYKALTVSSFWFGCSANLIQGVVTPAVACTLTVSGFRAGSTTPVASQGFVFDPVVSNILTNQPVKFTLGPQLAGVQTLRFVQADAATSVMFLDDIKGYLYQ